MDRIDVLGVGFDPFRFDEAVEVLYQRVRSRSGGTVVTPNPEIVQLCRKNDELNRLVNGADLVAADGIGVVLGAKLLGTPLPERLPGIELAQALCARMAAGGESLFLLGAKPGVAQAAADNLCRQYPGLLIAGYHDGYFSDDAPVVEQIRQSGAAAAFVCLGAPKQERFMETHRNELSGVLMMGLGGSLDVFAGNVKRAPRWMSKAGLEWFYRLACQPSRIGRMMQLPVFVAAVLARRGKGGKPK